MDSDLAIESFRFDNKEEWFELMVKCSHIPSVNSQYQHYGTLTFKSQSLIQYENELTDQLVYTDPRQNCPWLKPYGLYDVHFNFIMNHSFWKRDVSNCVKSTEDIIFRAIQVDDSRVLRHFDSKSFMAGDYERVIVRINTSNFKWNYFNEV